MMGIGHTGAYRGKRVRVFMRDGKAIDGRFKERNDRYVFLDHCKIEKRAIRSVAVIKTGE